MAVRASFLALVLSFGFACCVRVSPNSLICRALIPVSARGERPVAGLSLEMAKPAIYSGYLISMVILRALLGGCDSLLSDGHHGDMIAGFHFATTIVPIWPFQTPQK